MIESADPKRDSSQPYTEKGRRPRYCFRPLTCADKAVLAGGEDKLIKAILVSRQLTE